jgi:hypothetical protein
MYIYFQQLYDNLNQHDNHLIMMIVYVCLYILAILLRAVVCTGFRSALLAFRMDAKELKTRDDIRKMKNGILRKTTAEYIRLAEKSITRIPASALVNRQVSTLSLFGWRYSGIIQFVEALESGLIWVGMILTMIFTDAVMVYGTLTAAGFLLTRLAIAMFDFRTAQDALTDELLIYIEREVGHFYAADTGGAVLRLKDELSAAIGRQAASLTEAVAVIGTNTSEAMDKKLVEVTRTMTQAAKDWQAALTESAAVQERFNGSSEKMQAAGGNIMSASDLLAKHMQGHSNAMSNQLNALVSAIETLREHNELFMAGHDTLTRQSKYIETNQKTLDTTVQSYETALKSLAQNLGDGLGAYLKLYSQTASQTVNDVFAANLDKTIQQQQETLLRMTALFDQLRDQSRDVSSNLLTLHEKLANLGQKDGE